MMKIAIIEDEKRTSSFLQGVIQTQLDDVLILGKADSVTSAEKLLASEKPDALLLDVELGDGTGFDLLAKIQAPQPYIIFITAFEHYAISAFKANAIDYIMKPVDPDELFRALQKVKERIQQRTEPDYRGMLDFMRTHQSDRIAVPSGFGHVYINASHILYAAADGAYCNLYMEGTEQPLLISKTLKDVQKTLEKFGFIRIHRSYLVNISRITELNRRDGGYVTLGNGMRIFFSRQYRSEAMTAILSKGDVL